MTPVSLPAGTSGTPVSLGARAGATAIAVTPDGRTAYVVALRNMPWMPGFVLPIDTGTGAAGRPIYVGHEPLGIAFAP